MVFCWSLLVSGCFGKDSLISSPMAPHVRDVSRQQQHVIMVRAYLREQIFKMIENVADKVGEKLYGKNPRMIVI